MPLQLTTPKSEVVQATEIKTVKEYLIVKEFFFIEDGKERLEIYYRKGFDSTSGIIEYSDQVFSLILNAEETKQYFIDNPTVYLTVKSASYDLLKTRLELDGTTS